MGMMKLEDLMRNARQDFASVPRQPQDLACILYTSGTTGQPKGVRLSVENFASEQQATERALEITPEDKIIAVLPFFHVFGLSNVLHLALVHGASVVLIPQYSPDNLFRAIRQSRPTLIIAIPTMFIHLQILISRKDKGLPASIRLCVSGAAALPEEVGKAFEKACGAKILEGYGLTETVAACCLNPPEGLSKAGSIGKPLDGYEMKIVNDMGEDLPTGQTGEIAVRGKGVTRGYFNLPDETQGSFRHGWFLTGDMGYRDDDGYFFVTDRKKEIIIKGGLNISPREVEEALKGHPAVREAAIVGRQKGEREAVVAFVVATKEVSAKELVNYCRGVLSGFKVPNAIIFKNTLPMSVTGKVLKKELTEDHDGDLTLE